MWEYLMGGACIVGAAYFHAVSTGTINDSKANRAYWSNLRTRYPRLMRFGPPVVAVIGVLRIAIEFSS